MALGSASLATAGSASAATHDNGVMEQGEFGMYYNSYQGGCVFDLFNADGNFSGNYFKTGPYRSSCGGMGESTNDNTASFHNWDNYTWHVFTDSSGGGVHGWLDSGIKGNFSTNFKNEVSSAYWYNPYS
ncbi:hypothetical protein ACH492_34435 [Streptomyces sp. NPDC019443]|uniref:hypothetical protein n=1 Tax=Streptomyces sp. NPDC019443 TaxID=3365061 RepID=UPI0037906753